MEHPLERQYGLSAYELLDALDKRFRAKVTLEGAVAEVQMEKLDRVGIQNVDKVQVNPRSTHLN